MDIKDFLEKVVHIRTLMLEERYTEACEFIRKLQAKLEDLEEDSIIVNKKDLKILLEDEASGLGVWSDTSFPILEQLGYDPTQGV